MKKRLLLVIMALFLGTSVFAQDFVSGCSPLASDLANFTVSGKPSLAFFTFTTEEKNTNVEEYVTDSIIEAVFRTKKFKIVERSKLDKILAEQSFQSSGMVNEATAKDIGKIAGVDYVCFGSIMNSGDNLFVKARVVNVTTGEICSLTSKQIAKDDYLKYVYSDKKGSYSNYSSSSTPSTNNNANNNVSNIQPITTVYDTRAAFYITVDAGLETYDYNFIETATIGFDLPFTSNLFWGMNLNCFTMDAYDFVGLTGLFELGVNSGDFFATVGLGCGPFSNYLAFYVESKIGVDISCFEFYAAYDYFVEPYSLSMFRLGIGFVLK